MAALCNTCCAACAGDTQVLVQKNAKMVALFALHICCTYLQGLLSNRQVGFIDFGPLPIRIKRDNGVKAGLADKYRDA